MALSNITCHFSCCMSSLFTPHDSNARSPTNPAFVYSQYNHQLRTWLLLFPKLPHEPPSIFRSFYIQSTPLPPRNVEGMSTVASSVGLAIKYLGNGKFEHCEEISGASKVRQQGQC